MTDDERLDEDERMRVASGSVNGTCPVQALLYQLARKSLCVEEIEDRIDEVLPTHGKGEWEFINGHLAQWAADAAARLTGGGE